MFACSDEASLARALREPQDEAELRAALWALLGCVESGALMPSSELVDLLQGYQADSLLGAALAGLVLARLQPGPPSLVVLARVLPALVQVLRSFERDGFAPLRAGFSRRDVLAGRAVTTTLPALPQGVADGVDANGTLWLRTADGQRHAVASGDVSLRPAAAPPPPYAG